MGNEKDKNEDLQNHYLKSAKENIKAKKFSHWYLLTFGLLAVVLFLGVILFELGLIEPVLSVLAENNYRFYWMLLAGFCAEIIAGSLSVGYGIIGTTILMLFGIPPIQISASIHTAETFTTAAGSLSHWKLGNVNKKLVLKLAIPAVIGAIFGAVALTYFGKMYANFVKPFISLYIIYLGYEILKRGLKIKNQKSIDFEKEKKEVKITSLGFFGGFIDSFVGGGWGPLVTGTFLKKGYIPRYVIGTSTVAKFALTITSAITFFITIGVEHWDVILGLLIGGIVTAPFSAMLTSRLPMKKMFIIVGLMIMILGMVNIGKVLF